MTCCLLQDLPEGSRVVAGYDAYGYYKSQVIMLDEEHFLETRSYYYQNGQPKRITRLLNEELIRSDEWNADGRRKITTSYSRLEEWVWEKVIDSTAGPERITINRDSFMFFSLPEDLIRSLESGEFDPSRLLEIKWESVRETILEMLGAAIVVPKLPMQAVDQIGPNRLLRMEWQDLWGAPRMDPWCFLELHCNSTGKVSYLRVPPGFSETLSAIAWTFNMDKQNYLPTRET